MRATSSTMALASAVLGFDIVELWAENGEGVISCTYVHATESMKKKYTDLITGHYPDHKREHKLSPNLCKLAKASPEKYYWNVSDVGKGAPQSPTKSSVSSEKNRSHPLGSINPLYYDIQAPFETGEFPDNLRSCLKRLF
jgi:hypothetical protein